MEFDFNLLIFFFFFFFKTYFYIIAQIPILYLIFNSLIYIYIFLRVNMLLIKRDRQHELEDAKTEHKLDITDINVITPTAANTANAANAANAANTANTANTANIANTVTAANPKLPITTLHIIVCENTGVDIAKVSAVIRTAMVDNKADLCPVLPELRTHVFRQENLRETCLRWQSTSTERWSVDSAVFVVNSKENRLCVCSEEGLGYDPVFRFLRLTCIYIYFVRLYIYIYIHIYLFAKRGYVCVCVCVCK